MLTLPDTAVCACAEAWGLTVRWVLSAHPQAAGLLHGSPNVPISGFCMWSRWQRSHQLCGLCEPLLHPVW